MYQIDLVPTTALAVGLPIPFSNLGMLIPEVLLPYEESEDEGGSRNEASDAGDERERSVSDGYGGRVTPELLNALRTNAEQIHTYLMTYAEYSQDFPTGTFNSLKEKYESVLSQHEEFVRSPGRVISQFNLTSIANEYFGYMREVKSMCQSVWAKFDELPMTKGLFLLFLVVATTPIMLLDVDNSSLSLNLSFPGLKTCLLLAVLSLVVSNVEISLFGVLVLLFNFVFISLISTILVFLWKFRYFAVRALSRLKWPALFEVNFIQVLAVSLLVLYAVSMLSNSFILYEADMLAFFVQSLVLCFTLRALRLELLNQRITGKRTIYSSLVKKILPHFLLMCCVRLSKLFYACRDLQIQDGCESTSFIMPLTSAAEHLGFFSYARFVASVSSLLSIPAGVLIILWKSGYSKLLSGGLVAVCRVGFPLSVVGVVVQWIVQSLPHDAFLSLPHWQHLTPPWVVYVFSAVIVTLCVANPFRVPLLLVNSEDPVEGVATPLDEEDPPSTSKVPFWRSEGGVIKPRKRKTFHAENTNQDDGVRESRGLPAWTLMVAVTGILLAALWVPIAMLLNDGIALSAALTAMEIGLVLMLLKQSEEGTCSWPL